MNRKVSLLYSGNLTSGDLNIKRIVEFLGGTVDPVPATIEGFGGGKPASPGGCVIASARTLVQLRNAVSGEGKIRGLAAFGKDIFVYGFEGVPDHDALLSEWTLGGLIGTEPLQAGNKQIDIAREPICRQLAGLTFEASEPAAQRSFIQGNTRAPIVRIISTMQKPFCVQLRHENVEAMLMAGGYIPDIDQPVAADTSILSVFTGLAPLLMFLFHKLRPYVWHNDSISACFIVDDPLLKERYGCLKYDDLARLMDRQGFSTSIAFIPWNYRRSQRRVIELFAKRSLSLCVHGCDHTGAEFGGDDHVMLHRQAKHALERMERHRKLSGLDFDDVMVFPQGIFSTAGMRALNACGYLAAINSSVFSVDAGQILTLRDLLQVAVTRYSDLPLFKRWYPQEIPELAFNIFLGKPALLVEHHGYFRQGYGALAETIETLRRIEPRLQWSNLSTICSRACWTRESESGEIEVLFFTDRFEFRNETGERQGFVFMRQGVADAGSSVTINGRDVEIMRCGDDIRVHLRLDPGEAMHLVMARGQQTVTESHYPARTLRYQAAVFIRRGLSEFRDNYSLMNRVLNRAARYR